MKNQCYILIFTDKFLYYNYMNNNSRNNMNYQNNKYDFSNDSGFTLSGFIILIAMALKTFALVPTIYNISKDKITKNISYITPAFLISAFGLLFFVALSKRYFVACLLLAVGIVANTILIAQKYQYERNPEPKYMENVKDYNKLVGDYGDQIEEFESPYLI